MRSAILLLTTLASLGAAQNVTETRVDTTYTTTTICPVTSTSVDAGTTRIVTTLTTSTVTVTSCKTGCGFNTTTAGPTATASNPILYIPVESPRTETSIYTTTETRTLTNFVPQSTIVSTIGQATFYSTWLSIVYATTTATVTSTIFETLFPTPTAAPETSCPANTVYVTVTAPGQRAVPTESIASTDASPSSNSIPPFTGPLYPFPPGQTPVGPTGGIPTGAPQPSGAGPTAILRRANHP